MTKFLLLLAALLCVITLACRTSPTPVESQADALVPTGAPPPTTVPTPTSLPELTATTVPTNTPQPMASPTPTKLPGPTATPRPTPKPTVSIFEFFAEDQVITVADLEDNSAKNFRRSDGILLIGCDTGVKSGWAGAVLSNTGEFSVDEYIVTITALLGKQIQPKRCFAFPVRFARSSRYCKSTSLLGQYYPFSGECHGQYQRVHEFNLFSKPSFGISPRRLSHNEWKSLQTTQ